MRFTRPLAVAGLFTAAAIALNGCSATSSSSSDTGALSTLSPTQTVTITYESYNLASAGVTTDTINGLVHDFEKQNPNITVKAQAPQGGQLNATGSVQAQVLAGNAPDVAQMTFDTLDFAATSLGAQNLTKLVGEQGLREQFGGKYPYAESIKSLANLNGSTYGIPFVLSAPQLYYNQTLLEKAGVTGTPDLSTWDKVEEVAKKVTAYTGKPSLSVTCAVKGGDWCLQALVRSNGGRVLSEDRKSIQVGDNAAVGAVQELRDLYDAGVLVNEDISTALETFPKQDTAFQIISSSRQGAYSAAATAGGWTLGSAKLPAFGSKQAVPTNSGSALMMFSTDKDKQAAAWKFIQFMTSADAYQAITTKIGYSPLRVSMTEGDGPLAGWAKSNPLAKPNLEQLTKIQPWTSYPGDSYAQVTDIIASAVEQAVFYGKDPETTMSAAAKRAQELIGANK